MVKKKDNDDLNAEKRKSLLHDIHRKLGHVRNREDKLNEALSDLNEAAEKGTTNSAKGRNKTKELYQSLLKTSDSQIEYLRKLLGDVERIRRAEYKSAMKTNSNRASLMKLINLQGSVLPLYVGSPDTFAPPFVGGIPVPESTPLNPGDFTAAYENNNWILAEVISVTSNGRYDMWDVDSEEKIQFNITRRKLIPLPKWRADPQKDAYALFPNEAVVLALYPQTTCFYKGVIVGVPQTATQEYQVAFEDSSYVTGYSPPLHIHQKYVVSYKEMKAAKKGKLDDE